MIIVQPLGGLCNRMRSIVAAMDAANRLETNVVVIWTRDTTLNARFYEIFDKISCKVIECDLTSLNYKLLYHLYKDVLGYRFIRDREMRKIRENTELGDKTISPAIYKKIDDNIKKMKGQNLFLLSCEYITPCEDFSIFKLKEEIIKDTIGPKIGIMFGLHIRRSDNKASIDNSPTQLFIDKISSEIKNDSNVQFYLATDDINEEQIIKEMFKDNIIIYHKKSLDRNSPLGIRDAAIDLYNLAHCKKIYGSYGSSFSDIAALWGNIPKEVLKISSK